MRTWKDRINAIIAMGERHIKLLWLLLYKTKSSINKGE